MEGDILPINPENTSRNELWPETRNEDWSSRLEEARMTTGKRLMGSNEGVGRAGFRMRKIVFVVHTAYPQFIGGRERHVHNLARAMAAKGYDVSVLAGGKGKKRECRPLEGYTLILLPMWSLTVSTSPLQVYRFIPGLERELSALDPDIVHAFEYGSCTTDAAFMYAKQHQKRFFITVYGYKLGNALLRFAKHLYNRWMGWKIIQYAEKVICPSLAQQEEVLSWVPSHQREKVLRKIVVQGNGITCREFVSSVVEPERSPKDGEAVHILTVTRILPRKGMKYLVSAMQILRDELGMEHIKLRIVGPDCGERGELEALVRSSGLEVSISFEGEVPYHQVNEYLRGCDIFVLPSLYEGLPLALLEAMAAARPVVFTQLPCAQQIIRDRENGILVKPACAKSLAQGLELLIRDKTLRSRLGANAASCVHQFDSSHEADAVGALYGNGNLK